jgi:2-oxopent-4-enoate/cis-2-oxohex-4-enoate hydratase
MNMLNVHQPDFGYLLDGMVYNEGESIPMNTLIQPKAEGEIAFILNKDLMGPGLTNADVLRATECVMACFEIVDSRIQDWKIKIQDTVADNASCGVFVLGDRAVDPRKVDLAFAAWCWKRTATSSVPAPAPRRLATRSMPSPGWPTRWVGSAFRSRPAR